MSLVCYHYKVVNIDLFNLTFADSELPWPITATNMKIRLLYVFNEKDGWCPRGNNCLFEHIWQFCGSAYHNKTFASKQNLIQIETNAQVVTPIKVETFKQWLLGFHKKELQLLLDGFTYGFKIVFQGKRKYRIHENLISSK